MTIDIRFPTILKVGGGSLAEAAAILRSLRCARPLVVTDAFIASSGLADKLRQQLAAGGMACALFAGCVADPTTEAVHQGLQAYREGAHDGLVSLGGGSSIDTAKAIALLAANGGNIRDYRAPAASAVPGPPHLAIPTTAGTGSEVSRFTVISDSATQEKMLLASSSLIPSAAIVDYELTMTMPKRLTADTGTDSLTHAIEAYVSRKANAFSDALALSAMKTIWQQLPVAYHHPDDRPARETMMLAATLAGAAFSNASVALVHGMSRPLGFFFHIPHGLSNAMLLPSVTRFSLEGSPVRYATCARTMGIATERDGDQAAGSKLVEGLFRRNDELAVPSPRQFGIARERYFEVIPTMARHALDSGSPQNNPRVPDAAEIEQLYRELWQ